MKEGSLVQGCSLGTVCVFRAASASRQEDNLDAWDLTNGQGEGMSEFEMVLELLSNLISPFD
jgi:hypothetical protein